MKELRFKNELNCRMASVFQDYIVDYIPLDAIVPSTLYHLLYYKNDSWLHVVLQTIKCILFYMSYDNVDECILLDAMYAYMSLTDHKLHIVCEMLH